MENSKFLTNAPVVELSFLKKFTPQLLFLTILFAVIYFPTFSALIQMWWSSDDYSHGFLVPFISLYLAWMKRGELSHARPLPSVWSGVPLIALAGLMLVAGKLGGVMLLQELSLLVMITGLVLLLAGRTWLKILAFPIAYLLFMIKLFSEGDDRFHWPFQLLAANIGVWLLHLFGFAVYQEGIYIQLPGVTLEVATACSGVRFLLAIIAIGIPLAHFTQKTWPRKIGLVGFAVLIAILANGLRVAMIGVWTSYYGAGDDPHGPFHVLQGVFVSWIGFIALFAGAWILSRRQTTARTSVSPHQQHGNQESPISRDMPSMTDRDGGARLMPPWVLAAILLLVTGSISYLAHTTPLPLQHDLSTLPIVIGTWSGEAVSFDQEPFRVRGTDQEVARRYHSADGRTITLYIGYFNAQEQDRELVNYRTSWDFHRGETEITIPSESGGTHRVNQVLLRAGRDKDLAFFWYDLNGRMATGRYEAKLLTMWDALTRGRSNGAFILVFTPLTERGDPETSPTEIHLFIRDLLPILHSHISERLT